VLGVVVAGAMLVFGGELGDFTRKVIMLILAIALASSGTTVLAILFGNSGAVMGLYV
jgi:type IV secretion system protein VirB2